MNLRIYLAFGVSLWAAVAWGPAAYALPGLGGAASSSAAMDPSELSASIDSLAMKFTIGGDALIDAEIALVDALGNTEAAADARRRADDIRATGASPERNSEVVSIGEGLTAALDAAVSDKGELDDAAKGRIRQADLQRFKASMTVIAMLPDVVNVGLSVADMGQRVLSGAVDGGTFKTIKKSFDGLSKAVKFFDRQNKDVSTAMKKIYKARKIEPADYSSVSESTEASAF